MMVSTHFLNNSNLPRVGIVQTQRNYLHYSTTSLGLGLLNAQAKLWINEKLRCRSCPPAPRIILIALLQFSEPLVERSSLEKLAPPKVSDFEENHPIAIELDASTVVHLGFVWGFFSSPLEGIH